MLLALSAFVTKRGERLVHSIGEDKTQDSLAEEWVRLCAHASTCVQHFLRIRSHSRIHCGNPADIALFELWDVHLCSNEVWWGWGGWW